MALRFRKTVPITQRMHIRSSRPWRRVFSTTQHHYVRPGQHPQFPGPHPEPGRRSLAQKARPGLPRGLRPRPPRLHLKPQNQNRRCPSYSLQSSWSLQSIFSQRPRPIVNKNPRPTLRQSLPPILPQHLLPPPLRLRTTGFDRRTRLRCGPNPSSSHARSPLDRPCQWTT